MSDATVEKVARVVHEANRAYCIGLGDKSQLPWDEAPEWQRASARQGVKFHDENPGAGPADSHNSWLGAKVAAGWKYGPVKDADAKTHPCILPYEELPDHQQRKDALFIAVVRVFTHR